MNRSDYDMQQLENYRSMNPNRNNSYADRACDLLLQSGVPLSLTDLRTALGCSKITILDVVKRWSQGKYPLIVQHPELRFVAGAPGRPAKVYVRGWTSLSDLADYYAPEGHEDSTSDP